MTFKKITALIAAAAFAAFMTACSDSKTRDGGEITTAIISSEADTEAVTETAEVTEQIGAGASLINDREGGMVQVPDSVNTIVSTAPSITEILTGLGAGGKIIAADMYSSDVDGVDPSVCTLDFYNLNMEELIALSPDVIIISGMSMGGADDPYAALKETGINVIYVPTSESVNAVKLDIEFLAGYIGETEKGAQLIADIDAAVADITEKAAQVTKKKTVYFEMGAAPYLYTCGKGTFIDEIINLIGAENIYGSEEGWLSNSEETVIAADPDVILSNVQYDGYDFNEIKNRAGWENITAVKNGEVYSVSSNATSRPSQNIVDGIYEVARAVYPNIFCNNE